MILNPELRNHNTLNVIAVVSNPVRYNSRYKLFRQFREHMKACNVNLIAVELAFGDRHFEVTSADNPNDVQLRTEHEIWHKENLINLGIRRLSALIPDWKYVAWLDADIQFLDLNWAQETVHELQHHMIVQPFRDAIDMGPTATVLHSDKGPMIHRSFCYQYLSGATRPKNDLEKYAFWHPGFAWAARREFVENVGGLIDYAILGAADHHMALSLIGRAKESFPGGLTQNYCDKVLAWERLCELRIKRNIGYVDGVILHHWHGSKKKRYYVERWEILKEHQFDPDSHLTYDESGLLMLSSESSIGLRDSIRSYFRSRAEDSTDED